MILSRYIYGVKQAIRSLLHQHRLLSMQEKRDKGTSNLVGRGSIGSGNMNFLDVTNASGMKNRTLHTSISHRNKCVSKRELMIGAAAAELSKRFAAESDAKENSSS